MANKNSAGPGDESRSLGRDRRVTFAGMVPWGFWFRVLLLVAVAVAALGGVIVAVLLHFEIGGYPALVKAASGALLYGAGAAFMLGVVLVSGWAFPPNAMNFYRFGVDPEHRRVAMHLARDWRTLAPRIFAPIITHQGDVVYPGIYGISPAQGGVMVFLRMPDALPPGGIEAYLDAAAKEGVKRLNLPIFEIVVDRIEANVPGLLFVVRDATEDTREVDL